MKTKKNVVVRHASGMLGEQVVAREWKGRPYLANAPNFPEDREFTEQQIDQQERFRDATAYGKGVIKSENMPQVYEKIAENERLTTYNVAVRDFLRPPIVREIYPEKYTGKPGEEITVRAIDDVYVVGVRVVIRNNGDVVEQGEALRDEVNAALWRYTTTEENGLEGTTIEAYATDMPGNMTKGEVEL